MEATGYTNDFIAYAISYYSNREKDLSLKSDVKLYKRALVSGNKEIESFIDSFYNNIELNGRLDAEIVDEMTEEARNFHETEDILRGYSEAHPGMDLNSHYIINMELPDKDFFQTRDSEPIETIDVNNKDKNYKTGEIRDGFKLVIVRKYIYGFIYIWRKVNE